MNIHDNLEQNMKYISQFNGVCLNIEELIKLEIALNELHLNERSDELWFWGKIIGTERDYYIAEAIFFENQYQFPKKKFFWCNSLKFEFAELNPTQEYHLSLCQKYNTYFTGVQDTVLEKLAKDEIPEDQVDKVQDQPKNDDPDESLEIVKNVEPLKNFTELDRLGYVVRNIDTETGVVPEGAFKMLPIHEMRRNDNFLGLKAEDLPKLKKYLHFRDVMTEEKKEFIEMDEAIFSFNFLDNLESDVVKGSWSIQLDSTKTISNIRSLLWPGYFAFHKANSKQFGSVYIGFGIKNAEFPFMI